MTKKILDSMEVDGSVAATAFSGSGAALTNIPQNAVLTGLAPNSGGLVQASDTILVAINKLEYKTNNFTGGTGTDVFYTHNQPTASNIWTITHNLNKYPSVTVVDSANNVVIGDVTFTDTNVLVVNFGSSFGGKAYLN